MKSLTKLNILGVDITKASKNEVLEYILETAKSKKQKAKVYTPNPEIVVMADKNQEYKTILNKAEIATPDGVGLVIAGKILDKPLKEKISGIDLMESICEKASHLPVSIGLLGGEAGIAERTAECLIRKYPGLNIVFVASEWPVSVSELGRGFKIYDSRFKNELKKFLNHESIFMNHLVDILFVAFGSPKQEEWIAENIEKLPVRVMMGVGGAFDMISGKIPRAPEFIRDLGFEWLYRLIHEPWRWRRQMQLIRFMYLVIHEKLISH